MPAHERCCNCERKYLLCALSCAGLVSRMESREGRDGDRNALDLLGTNGAGKLTTNDVLHWNLLLQCGINLQRHGPVHAVRQAARVDPAAGPVDAWP